MCRVKAKTSSGICPTACGLLVVAALILSGCGENDGLPAQANVTELPVPAAAGSAEPHLAPSPDGRLVLSWLEPSGGKDTLLRFAVLDAGQWGGPTTVARGSDWFVNWADFPSVVPITADLWAAHWLRKREGGTYAYDVAVSLSGDGGITWAPPFSPHTDGTATEHGFVTLFPLDGKVGALWLDGREMTPDRAHGHDDHGGDGAMTLRSAVIGDDAALEVEMLADDRVCDCCQTDVALADGVPVAVYRNRSEDEIRDIFVTRSTGDGWEPGVAIADDGWQIAACPVNGPAIDATGSSVAVAWFTAAGDRPTVKLAISRDGGKTFGDPVEIATGRTFGRVDVVLNGDGSAIVSHLDAVGDGAADILLQPVGSDGTLASPIVAARTAAGRMSGFPQLARHGEDLLVVWTDSDGDVSQVRSAVVALP